MVHVRILSLLHRIYSLTLLSFFLCGFGYALDLMWAQAFSLVTPRIQQELGIAGMSHFVSDDEGVEGPEK